MGYMESRGRASIRMGTRAGRFMADPVARPLPAKAQAAFPCPMTAKTQ